MKCHENIDFSPNMCISLVYFSNSINTAWRQEKTEKQTISHSEKEVQNILAVTSLSFTASVVLASI